MILTFIFTLLFSVSAFATYERGDEGKEVLEIQKRLVQLSYKVSDLDGRFGPETEQAIKQYQKDRNLYVDGIVGNDTYNNLMQREMPPNRSGRSVKVKEIIRAAYSVTGTPYVFGGTSRYGFDCSGFTQFAFARAGVSLPRTADAQYYYGRKISFDDLSMKSAQC